MSIMDFLRFCPVRHVMQPENSAQFPDTMVFQFRTKFNETEIVHKDSTACFYHKVILVLPLPVFTLINFKIVNKEVWQITLHEDS